MVVEINFRNVFVFLETFERGLNFIGYIPFVGTLGAFIRNNYAKIEAITGIALAIFALGLHFQGNPNRVLNQIAVVLIGHAILNELRSYIEAVPGSFVVTLPYDLLATAMVGGRFFSYV